MIIRINSEEKMKQLGQVIGASLIGGEVIELIGDVGAGKTTLVKGIAIGLNVAENVQSPSFTISREYNCRDNLKLAHYDFYRLVDAGIMAEEISESINDKKSVTIIEWGEIIKNILPKDKLSIKITAISDDSRQVEINNNDKLTQAIEKSFSL